MPPRWSIATRWAIAAHAASSRGSAPASSTARVTARYIAPVSSMSKRSAAIAQRVAIDQRGGTTLLDGRDVSAAIRGPDVTATVSTVSAHPSVRAVLVAHQRGWVAARPGGVVEGRDIGTVVIPDAAVKVFLTASAVERARRRRDEAQPSAEVGEVEAELGRRDELDRTRAASPLQPAPDALRIDTTGRPVDEVVRRIVNAFRARTAAPR